MRAIDKYDPLKGAKFSSYAVIWIKQSIGRNIFTFSEDISLDAPVKGAEDLLIRDMIEDDSIPVTEKIEDRVFCQQLRELIDEKLTTEEKDIVYMKYGFKVRQYTAKDIGEKIGMKAGSIPAKVESILR
ncbi:hypothetical protein CCE28_00770 [Anaeromicrobium sediminis]|uniref:Uncharacterized protein n=2 Tax=Anaeromicrobium sediminis TaxID=1478221 RepID=A0A267MNJ8_9FIRM|nr:hypothetical protein CCE28_00770 [Anaeromicrobium sediminis]